MRPPAGTARGGLRRPLGWLFLAGGAVVLVVSIGLVAIGAVLLQASDVSRAPVLFSAGERVEVPDPALLNAADLIIYGGDSDEPLKDPGCTVTSRGGTQRVVGLPMLTDDLRTEQGTLDALLSVHTWRAGDVVLCDGPAAASFEPLALGLDGGSSRTAAVLGFGFAVFAFVVGALFLGTGWALQRRRA